jgi:hypothetical protein
MPQPMTNRAQKIALGRLRQEIRERPMECTQRELLRGRIAVVKVECRCTSGVSAIDAAAAEGNDQIELSASEARLLGSI